MDPVCRILADARETSSGVIEALRALAADVEIRRLEVGDYALGERLLVERKTVRGLHLSIVEGRLWSQLSRLRRATQFPYLVVEGPDIDDGPLGASAVRGACVAIIGQGIPLVFTSDKADTAVWLRLLALRSDRGRISRDRPRYAHPPKPSEQRVAEAMLAAVPNISVQRARALLSRFGSVTGVVSAGHDAWLQTPGIGPAAARELQRALT